MQNPSDLQEDRINAPHGIAVWATKEQHRLDKELAAQAELAYRRLVQDWQPAINKGTGAAPGRASCGPSSGQAARQETAPPPAL
jgi:hypothetical protein